MEGIRQAAISHRDPGETRGGAADLTDAFAGRERDGVTLLYTGLASPLSWDVPGAAQAISLETVAHFRGPNPNSYAFQFGDSIEDGHAIMAP